MTLRRPSAFTLIELLVSIVIIGLLSTLATTSYLTSQRRSRDSARKAHVATIASALETYRLAKGTLPGALTTATNVPDGVCASIRNPGSNVFYYASPTRTCETEAGSWIPGMSPFLNPYPQDPRADFPVEANAFIDPIICDAGNPGRLVTARTISYRRLSATSYLVAARLEEQDGDSATATAALSSTIPTYNGCSIRTDAPGYYTAIQR